MTTSKKGQVQHINPDALSKNPAFTNVISVTGNVKTFTLADRTQSTFQEQLLAKEISNSRQSKFLAICRPH